MLPSLSPPRSKGPKYVSVLVEISIEHPPRPAAGDILKLSEIVRYIIIL